MTSEPEGASVRIDGSIAGETPVQLGNMAPGPVRISMGKNGYVGKEKRETLKAGRRTVLNFVLDQENKNGWLTVLPTPANARVRIIDIGQRYRDDM